MLGFTLGLIQMALYAFYKNCSKVVVQEKKLPEAEHELKNIVVVNTLTTSEVLPGDPNPAGDHNDRVDHKDANKKEHDGGRDQDQEKSMEGSDGSKPNDESPV